MMCCVGLASPLKNRRCCCPCLYNHLLHASPMLYYSEREHLHPPYNSLLIRIRQNLQHLRRRDNRFHLMQ